MATKIPMVTLIAALFLSTACTQSVLQRGECDRAVQKICAADGIDCETRKPAVVGLLERCEHDEVVTDRQGNLPICINESSSYTKILAALDARDPVLCTMSCSNACDAVDACNAFQFASCSVPDGGASDAS
jgi:hypothetical protein